MYLIDLEKVYGEGSMPRVVTSPAELFGKVGDILNKENTSDYSIAFPLANFMRGLRLDFRHDETVKYLQRLIEEEMLTYPVYLALKEHRVPRIPDLTVHSREIGIIYESIPLVCYRFNSGLPGLGVTGEFWRSAAVPPVDKTVDVPFQRARNRDLRLCQALVELPFAIK